MSDEKKQHDLKLPNINYCVVAGRLTRDPELKFLGSGTALCKLSLVISETYKDKSGEMKENTVFIDVTVWGAGGEWVGERGKKGYPFIIEGKLTQSEWTDKESGKKRNKIEINAHRCQQLSWRNLHKDEGTAIPEDAKVEAEWNPNAEEADGSDLPF